MSAVLVTLVSLQDGERAFIKSNDMGLFTGSPTSELDVGAARQEYLCCIHMTLVGRTMQQSTPILVLRWHVGAVTHKHPCQINMSLVGCTVKWSPSVLVLR